MEQEFKDLRELLLIAAICKKPEQAEFEKLLAPLLKDIEGISRANEVGRKDRDWVSHFSTVSTAAPCVGWVTIVSRSPNGFVYRPYARRCSPRNLRLTWPTTKTQRSSTLTASLKNGGRSEHVVTAN